MTETIYDGIDKMQLSIIETLKSNSSSGGRAASPDPAVQSAEAAAAGQPGEGSEEAPAGVPGPAQEAGGRGGLQDRARGRVQTRQEERREAQAAGVRAAEEAEGDPQQHQQPQRFREIPQFPLNFP